MKIALGQMNVLSGMMSKNVETMLSMIQQAKNEKADLIVFPELCISGSLLTDKWMDESFLETVMSYNDVILNASEGIGVIWGNISLYENTRLNCIYFAHNSKWVERENSELVGYTIKTSNTNQHIYDDSRYFMSGFDYIKENSLKTNDLTAPFLFKDKRIYCEFMNDFIQNKETKKDDYLVLLDSSYWTKDKNIEKELSTFKIPLVYVNHVGMQNTSKTVCVYDGNSGIYNNGQCIACCNDSFNEECKVVSFDQISLSEKCEYKWTKALIHAIQQFDKQIFNSRFKWIIGLSGGLDSSVNAALLTLALGKDRIIGLNMATRYNSSTTIDNAHSLANACGFECRDGIIQQLVEEQIHCLQQYTTTTISDFAIENIQARIRGSILGAISQIENGIVINNGNKIEGALGYATLYGDTIGCLAPLQDITKVELFDIARSINTMMNQEVIPENLLPTVTDGEIHWIMPPSAELKNNQLDPMKWFYHDELIKYLTEYPGYKIEDFMMKYLDESIYETEIGHWIKYYGLDDPQKFMDDLEWVLSKFELGVFKRLQTPPIVCVSNGCFGSDFRENQTKFEKTQKYLALKKAILSHEN